MVESNPWPRDEKYKCAPSSEPLTGDPVLRIEDKAGQNHGTLHGFSRAEVFQAWAFPGVELSQEQVEELMKTGKTDVKGIRLDAEGENP